MGNLVSSGAKAGGGKVVMADGSVRALREPVSVAELMMDHPRHYVIDARVLKEQRNCGGATKVAPLPADRVLGAGGVYVLLPATRRGRVSAEEARRALTAARSLARSRSLPAGLTRKLSYKKQSRRRRGGAGMAVQHVPASAVVEEEEEEETARLDGFEEHRAEFLSRELSSRGWKPSLRTIQERAAPKKARRCLIGSSERLCSAS